MWSNGEEGLGTFGSFKIPKIITVTAFSTALLRCQSVSPAPESKLEPKQNMDDVAKIRAFILSRVAFRCLDRSSLLFKKTLQGTK